MKKFSVIVFCLILIICGCSCGNVEDKETGSVKTIQITDGVYITDISSYSGDITENDSVLKSTNTLCITVKNTSGKHYEYLNFELFSGGQRYKFSLYTLFNGSTVKVLEKDSARYNDKINVTSCILVDCKPFTQKPTVHLDEFKISCTDGIINVENITEKIFNNVRVYFKYFESDVFLGGVTYCVNAGDLHGGETVQIPAEKYIKGKSKVVFVTYDE